MQSQVTLREKTGPRAHLVDLHLSAAVYFDASANPCAVTALAFERNAHPVPLRAVVAHQGRHRSDIGHQYVNIAVVVIVTEGRATTDAHQRQRAVRRHVFFETPLTDIEVELVALREGRILVFLDIALQMAIGHKEVAVTIVVDVEEARAPGQIGNAPLAQTGEERLVDK